VERYWIFVILFVPLVVIFISFSILAVHKTCEEIKIRQNRRRIRNEKKSEI
jgi:hypothetical protein